MAGERSAEEPGTAVINPGGGAVPLSGAGWENTYGVALAEAERWHRAMEEEGLRDLELIPPQDRIATEGRWTFGFRHSVTGVMAFLQCPGVDDPEVYLREHTFRPRSYWNGDSAAEPELSDWAAEGYAPVMTFRTEEGRG